MGKVGLAGAGFGAAKQIWDWAVWIVDAPGRVHQVGEWVKEMGPIRVHINELLNPTIFVVGIALLLLDSRRKSAKKQTLEPVEPLVVLDSIGAKFLRQHFVNRDAYDDLTRQACELMKIPWPETAHDLLCEIHLVNREQEPITIQRIEALAQIKGHSVAMTPADLDNYQLAFDKDEKLINSPIRTIFEQREDLPSLWEEIKGVELRRGIGYQGWVAFGLMAKEEDLTEKVIFEVTIVDSLEGEHPVLLTGPTDLRGRITHKVKKP